MKFVHNYGNGLLRSYFSRKFHFSRMNWTDEGTQLVGTFGKIEGELRERRHVSQDTVLSKICGSMQRANRLFEAEKLQGIRVGSFLIRKPPLGNLQNFSTFVDRAPSLNVKIIFPRKHKISFFAK